MFSARPDQSKATPARSRILAQIVLGVNALCLIPAAAQEQPALPEGQAGTETGAESQPAAPLPMDAPSRAVDYSVRIDSPRNLRELLEDNLDLLRWRGNPRLDIDQLQRLVRVAPEQAKTLIATEGYYTPTSHRHARYQRRKPVARIVVEPASRCWWATSTSCCAASSRPTRAAPRSTPPPCARAGAAGRHAASAPADWEAAKRGLLRQIMQSRFPRAQLLESSATVDPDATAPCSRWSSTAAPMRASAPEDRRPAALSGQHHHQPEPDPPRRRIQRGRAAGLQGKLQETGYFATVEVSADMSGVVALKRGGEPAEPGRGSPKPAPPAGPVTLPVLVRVTENKQQERVARRRFLDQHRRARPGHL
jgi:translocation and assembly module TamA